jgi:hypothetical protein
MNAPAWRLHRLSGDLADHWSIDVSGNWRVTLTFQGQDAILVDYQDYHLGNTFQPANLSAGGDTLWGPPYNMGSNSCDNGRTRTARTGSRFIVLGYS